MFVNRKNEFKKLEESYRLFLMGHSQGVLIYGFRKVGKTRLIEEFLKDKNGLLIDLSPARSLKALCRIIVDRLTKLSKVNFDCKIDLDSLVNLFLLPQKIASKNNINLIIAFDEFHIPLEKISSNLSRVLGEKKERIISDILWSIRSAITNSKNVFWILISSIGWKKLQDYISRKYGGPLVGVLDTIRIDPLSYEASTELALVLTKNPDMANRIASVSGGIPRIVEILSRRYNTTKEGITKLVINAILEGEFDEIFDNMIRTIADVSRRDFGILQLTLKCVAEGSKNAEKVAICLDSSRDTAYVCLEELHTLGLLKKEKEKKYVRYGLQYPLLSEWLRLRVEPRRKLSTISVGILGITAESYIRELLSELIDKKIEINDDREGNYLAGTAEKLILEIEKVLSKKETEQFLGKIKNADIIAYGANTFYVIEVKAKAKPITKQDIEQLVFTARRIDKNITPILIMLLEAKITHTAIAYAIKNSVIIITAKGIKLLAKKANFPHW
ncbi:MAG: ATP-binding protein [Candidatus Njordarchaeota archaeon]